MNETLFLYIDILGFKKLVAEPDKVEELYRIIDNFDGVREWRQDFQAIVFSDTILIFYKGEGLFQDSFLVPSKLNAMHSFVRDLFYRLVGQDLHFRALLTKGPFKYARLEHIEYYFGDALISTHEYEKKIQATGLFIDNRLLTYIHAFEPFLKTDPYDDHYSYVHLIPTLARLELGNLEYPIKTGAHIHPDSALNLAYDVTYIRNIYSHMNNMSSEDRIRQKYVSTWNLMRKKYAHFLDALVQNSFDPKCIIDMDWSDALSRVGTDQGMYG